MSGSINCPNCGANLRKGSTFCLKCGTRITDGMAVPPISPELNELPESPLDDVEEEAEAPEETLPDLDEWEDEDDSSTTKDQSGLDENSEAEGVDKSASLDESLSWEEGLVHSSSARYTEVKDTEEPKESISDMAWETPKATSSDVKEGMPFKEVEPPKVVEAEAPTIVGEPSGKIPEAIDPATEEAVTHLFPHGRGETSTDFIDTVVGKPKKIGGDISPCLVETPSCPDCGSSMTTDSFEYPAYVYEAMGKARLENGMKLLKDNAHEDAIEQFEIAKKLYEHAENEKMVEESTKRVDQGYDEMAEHHFVQGEAHLKEDQFEWAIVQFRKARELYMFSTDSKKRAKCSEKVRDSYEDWGKLLEDQGDKLAKTGDTRSALAKYTDAAEKYREADASKRIRGLEKKIRKA